MIVRSKIDGLDLTKNTSYVTSKTQKRYHLTGLTRTYVGKKT
jgi:hypothetical protein